MTTVNATRLSHRPVQNSDLPVICGFPRTEQELFLIYPKAQFPLTVEQLKASIDARSDSTAFLCDGQTAGFANLYRIQPGDTCWMGNVIVDPQRRGGGIGTYLVQTMTGIAVKKYQIKTIELFCMSHNITGLFLYQRLGFKPTRFEERFDHQGNRIASIHMILDIPVDGVLNPGQ